MNDAPLLDLMEGRAARDSGIASVLEHQDETWREAYRTAADEFLLSLISGCPFKGEDIRRYALQWGVGQPRDPHAWSGMAGSVIKAWLRQGAIEPAGMEQARAVKSHATWQRLYRVR